MNFPETTLKNGVNHPLVSKLVINTTDPIPIVRVIRTLHALVSSDKGHKIEFDKLCVALSKADHSSAQNVDDATSTNKGFCTRTHRVKIYRQKGIGWDATCGVCQNPVTQSDAAYTCEFCPLAIHKSCADNKKEFTPENFPKFLRLEPKESFCYPEEHLCLHCEKEGKEFSYECGSCVFECHLKCQLIPTILQHPAHEHLLYILVKPISKGLSYQCMACRDDRDNVAYNCVKGCRGSFHPKCLLLPPVVREHTHCGYTHDLEMVTHRDKEMEDYICHLCFELMNPDAWYYCCRICHLDMHLTCAFEEFK